jgi:GNAT superfamily N-acetyltransferase
MSQSPRYRMIEVDGTKKKDLLLELQLRCFPGDTAEDPARGYWWIVYQDGLPAAFAGIRDVKRQPDYGFFNRAGVLPAHRGRGLHHRLIEARVRKARSVGWKYVVTTTYDNNRSANNLIEHGFRLYTPVNEWMCDGTLYWIRETAS